MKSGSLALIVSIGILCAACAKPKAELTVSKSQIRQGESVSLNWETKNAKQVLLNGQSVSQSGTQLFEPNQTTTYELIGKRGNKTAKDNETVTVEVLPAAPQISITVSQPAIIKGSKTTLRWSSQRAESVEISQLGKVAASGEKEILPSESITYTAFAKGPGGETSASTRVTVTDKIVKESTDEEKKRILLRDIFNREMKSIFFEYDSAELQAEAQRLLNKNAQFLSQQEYKSIMFRIEGNCDPRGSEEYNLALGDRRANVAKSYLISQGIDPTRIDITSNGKRFAAGVMEGEPEKQPSWSYDRRDDSIYLDGGELKDKK